jgi:hypothetical protein
MLYQKLPKKSKNIATSHFVNSAGQLTDVLMFSPIFNLTNALFRSFTTSLAVISTLVSLRSSKTGVGSV